jgi:uncharacterized protein YjbI with pentapeptide repeats
LYLSAFQIATIASWADRAFAKPIAVLLKTCFPFRFQCAFYQCLLCPFKQNRYSQRTLFGLPWLRYPDSPDDALQWGRKGIDIRGADLSGEDLRNLPFAGLIGSLNWAARNAATKEKREMASVHMEGAKFMRAHLERARLHEAHLENADFEWAYMEEANLRGAHLDGAGLHFSYLKGAFFRDASLKGADLTGAFLERTRFVDVALSDEEGTGPFLADAQWKNINLALVKWHQKGMLGDEYKARQKTRDGQPKDKSMRLDEYEQAVRANRQLAVALQAQGLNENAAYFAYRAQKLQRIILRRQRNFGQYFFSGFLDLLAGYGYRPGRSVLWYLITIFAFALIYFAIGHLPFFPGLGSANTLHNPLVVIAAFEAVVGLVIEISFIATFTQRFFGR